MFWYRGTTCRWFWTMEFRDASANARRAFELWYAEDFKQTTVISLVPKMHGAKAAAE